MKWIGQHIWDFYSRFRNDVYLEDIDTGTIASGGNLGLDSDNKIVKATVSSGSGDLTAIVAGTGLSGSSLSGPIPTLVVDFSEFGITTPADGDWLVTLDSDGATEQRTTLASLATLFAGTGLDASSSVLSVDVSDFMANGSNNRVLTATGTDAMNAESNLTFNGTTLACVGNATITPGVGAGATALTITNAAEEGDQIALDIVASNTTADVINITADAVTTGNVIDISCDALTTGSGLFIDDNSAVSGIGGIRSIAKFRQNNTAATAATALEVISNGAATGVLIDKNASGTTGQNASALWVDFDRTVAGSGTAAHNDIGINLDVTSASLGTSTLKGMEIDVVGATSGDSTAIGIDITMSGADDHFGIKIKGPDTGMAIINNATSSATEGGKIRLISSDGAAMGDDHRLGVIEFEAGDGSVGVTGASIEAFADAAWSTSENGGRLVFSTTDGDDTQSVVLTLDSDKLATFAGAVTVTGALTMPDDTVTFAKAVGVTPNIYGNVIKLIPSDFMANDDGGNQKFGVGYLEHPGATTYGMRVANNATELFAFVSIPEGMKATHVDIYDKNDLAIEVFEVQINATTMVSKGSGKANTQLTLSDEVSATATNFLAIQVTTISATNDLVWGGQVTIAPQ